MKRCFFFALNPNKRTALSLCLLMAAAFLTGCATSSGRAAGQRLDPYEPWNRDVFAFNERLDNAVLKPAATAYSNIVPQPVRRGVDNFFGNVSDAWSAINCLLQGKVTEGLHDLTRFGTNTVFGLGGVLDVATEFGLDGHHEDFGQTLGYWGVNSGAYLVLPLLGPSTVRDTAALPLDRAATPAAAVSDGGAQIGITALQIINTRANLLGASKVIDDIALDKYTFIRDAYLQRRRSLTFDGDEPTTPEPVAAAASEPAAAPPAAPSQPASK